MRATFSTRTTRPAVCRSGGARAATLAGLILLTVTPAVAHHRQTPPVVPLTTAGDTPLPRLVAPGRESLVFATPAGGGREIVTVSPFRNANDPSRPTVVAGAGPNANPAMTDSGQVVTFDSGSDPLGLGLPGRQVVGAMNGGLFAVSRDPGGASENPSPDASGLRIAFESTTDLTGTGTPGIRQVFLRDRDGSIRQLSRGLGAARNPVLSPRRNLVLFESSSDPVTGADNGVAQILVRRPERPGAGSDHCRLGGQHEPHPQRRRPPGAVRERR